MPRKFSKSNYGYKNAVQEAVSEGLISGSTLSKLDYQILLDKLNANQKRVVPFANTSKTRYALLKSFQRFQAKTTNGVYKSNGIYKLKSNIKLTTSIYSTDISIEPADKTLIEANLKCFRKECHSGNESLNRSVLVDNLNAMCNVFKMQL